MFCIMVNKLEFSLILLYFVSFLIDLYSLMVMQVSEKGFVLIVVVDSEILEEIIIDVICLCQVLINLVNNVIKFILGGQVIIWVKVDVFEKLLFFSVEDIGIGMFVDKLDKIF